jgi:hypothetical protein
MVRFTVACTVCDVTNRFVTNHHHRLRNVYDHIPPPHDEFTPRIFREDLYAHMARDLPPSATLPSKDQVASLVEEAFPGAKWQSHVDHGPNHVIAGLQVLGSRLSAPIFKLVQPRRFGQHRRLCSSRDDAIHRCPGFKLSRRVSGYVPDCTYGSLGSFRYAWTTIRFGRARCCSCFKRAESHGQG